MDLMRQLAEIPADFVLVDLGAGTDPAVMDYFMVGENGIEGVGDVMLEI